MQFVEGEKGDEEGQQESLGLSLAAIYRNQFVGAEDRREFVVQAVAETLYSLNCGRDPIGAAIKGVQRDFVATIRANEREEMIVASMKGHLLQRLLERIETYVRVAGGVNGTVSGNRMKVLNLIDAKMLASAKIVPIRSAT